MKSARKAKVAVAPLNHYSPIRNVCLSLQDQSTLYRSAVDFFDIKGMRDPTAPAAILAERFITRNRPVAALLDLNIQQAFDGREVKIIIRSGNTVGAIPLISPTSARFDYCAVVQPRFPWSGLGSMLAEMGWRVAPSPLKLPLLNSSDRRIPAWVLSYMVLSRLKALLISLTRRFEQVEELLRAPRGSVSWSHYATRSIPNADPLTLRCSFSELREDRLLLAAVHYTLQLQIGVLEAQKEHGTFVGRLIEMAQDVKRHVQAFKPVAPSPVMLSAWFRAPLRSSAVHDGLEAIEWATQNRGLAGLSTLSGIPWNMRMDSFYEAWVETVFALVARRVGASLKVGRLGQTVQPIDWSPPSSGSQASLIPDLVLESEGFSILVDAKYKRHLEELELERWSELPDAVHEQHRNDLFQALAYAHLAASSNVIVCLSYPSSRQTWQSLKERQRTVRTAAINAGVKSLCIWLAAIPMAVPADEIAKDLMDHILANFVN